MPKRRLILGSIVCLITGMLVGRTLSNTRGGFEAGSGFGRPPSSTGRSPGISRSRSREVTDESKQASLKGAVGATDEQWVVIKPKLEKVRQLRKIACIGIMTSGGGSGGSQSQGGFATGSGVRGGAGAMNARAATETKAESSSWMRWQWYRSWGSKPAQSDDEKLCDDLLRLLRSKKANPEQIRQKMNALSNARELRRQELARARKELRELLTPDQEARLVALHWLD